MKNIYKIIFLLVLGAMAACDYDLDKVNPNGIIVENYYKTEADLNQALTSAYSTLQSVQLTAREWFFVHDLRSDDMATGGGQLEVPRAQLLIGSNDPANSVAEAFYNGWFGEIKEANVVIDKSKNITGDNVARMVGEAKVLRAWAYYELVCEFGGVPLYENYVTTVNGAKPRATVEEVYTSIINNLTDAIAVLPLSYSGADLGRITKGAAEAMLARVYMQHNEYAKAKTQLQDIIGSGVYSLTDNYNDNYMEETEYNKESVLEVGFKDNGGSNFNWGGGDTNGDGLNGETTIHNQEINPLTWGNLIPSPTLLAEFESTDVAGNTKTDPRFHYSFYKAGDTIVSGVLKESDFNIASSVLRGAPAQKIGWRKHTLLYKLNKSYYPSGNNERVIHYSEVLLMMAECQNETNDAEATVLATLNQVRNRASVKMPFYPTANYPTTTKDQRFVAIVHEKRVELAGEEIRNRDILRWRAQGKIPTIIPEPISYFVKNKYELLPIPQNSVDRNPNIGQTNQNPGY
jgi:starch-binding outer membrane protein, SusD/RagB family